MPLSAFMLILRFSLSEYWFSSWGPVSLTCLLYSSKILFPLFSLVNSNVPVWVHWFFCLIKFTVETPHRIFHSSHCFLQVQNFFPSISLCWNSPFVHVLSSWCHSLIAHWSLNIWVFLITYQEIHNFLHFLWWVIGSFVLWWCFYFSLYSLLL